jgi:hypothetical protein
MARIPYHGERRHMDPRLPLQLGTANHSGLQD